MPGIEEHVEEYLSAYALDILDEADRQRVVRHLQDCADCRRALMQYEQLVGILALNLPQGEPPPELRDRILSAAAQARLDLTSPIPQPGLRQRSQADFGKLSRAAFGQLSPGWALVGLTLILLLTLSNLLLWRQMAELQRQIARQSAALQSALRAAPLSGTENAPNAIGTLVISLTGEYGVLVVDGLPPLDAEHQYQLWLIMDGQRVSGGVFSVNDEGYGALYVSSPAPLSTYQALGVTVEPAGGSPGPTGAKVLGGEL